jgi:hypothetical protein
MMVHVSGEIDMVIVRTFVSELVFLMKKHKCERILNDLRGTDLRLSTVDIYNIPRLASDAGLEGWTKKALVVNANWDDYRFLETVSVNAAHTVRIFNDIEEAKEWLTTEEGNSNPPIPRSEF